MTLKPCLVCGEPSSKPRCDEHRPKDTRQRRGPGQAAYDPVWRRLSLRARRLQPWCLDCGATEDLTSDHIIPKSLAPELVHARENIAVRCCACNSRRGTTGFTHAEVLAVIVRLEATYRRHPTRTGRERLDAARRASDQGGCPKASGAQPFGEAFSELHTPGGYT
ncbi:HNH endonuclease [Mycolicibacterium holsaticum]|uniref:HNH endonuclease n=1 Tax=Mycolicibacterium holsaticum TaxID=152142 RepID=UPI000A02188E|nr:HNH endonuclease [Mycolicibacterium holsaticum]